MKKSNIAILCMTHVIDDNFKLLINRLSPDFDIYVHFDKKSEPSYAKQIEAIKSDKVKFIKSAKVYWGGYSLSLSEYNLLKEAFSSGKTYSHYLLISGADFPIKSNEEISEFFHQNQDVSFLSYSKLPTPSLPYWMERVNKYWFTEFKNRKITSGLGKITLSLQRLLGINRKLYFKEYYGGSNWVNLSHSAVAYILNYIEKNPRAFKSFKRTMCSDELWKQTILHTSKELVLINDSLRYIDWRKGPERPRILDETDYEAISKSNALFARKVKGKDLTLQKMIMQNFINPEMQ